jgi:hypothetical protein
MDKINFINGQQPAINATNLNQMQTNIENAINNVNSWDKADVNLSYSQTATIDGLKKAKEAIVCFYDSENIITMTYPRILTNNWLSTYVKTSAGGDGRCVVRINFETGVVQNGAQGYVDLAIKKILWK